MLEDLGQLLKSVGTTIMELRYSAASGGTWEGTQLKTEADRLAHRELSTGLHSLGEDIPVISEEDLKSHAADRPRRYWLIDPIDGTASFSGGYDGFVTQVALIEDFSPTLAAVYAPALQLTYLAAEGRGSTLNGRRLDVGNESKRTVLIDNYPEPKGSAADAIKALNCTDYLESGSIGLKICRIADGQADLFFKDVVVRDWDIAPGHLILTEAGGEISDLHGSFFPFDGPFEKPGVIACRCGDLLQATASWLESYHQDVRD